MQNSANLLTALPELALRIYIAILMLRFLFALTRLERHNPLVQAGIAVTNAPLRLLRRFVPGLYGVDLTPVVLAILLGVVRLVWTLTLLDHEVHWGGVFLLSAVRAFNVAVWILLLAVLGGVIISWVAPHSGHPLVRAALALSEPAMAPFRRILPPLAGLDFSPIAALFALQAIQRWVINPLMQTAISWM